MAARVHNRCVGTRCGICSRADSGSVVGGNLAPRSSSRPGWTLPDSSSTCGSWNIWNGRTRMVASMRSTLTCGHFRKPIGFTLETDRGYLANRLPPDLGLNDGLIPEPQGSVIPQYRTLPCDSDDLTDRRIGSAEVFRKPAVK